MLDDKFMNEIGEEKLEEVIEEIEEDAYKVFSEGDRYGFASRDGRIRLLPKYKKLVCLARGDGQETRMLFAGLDDKYWRVIIVTDKEVKVEGEYSCIEPLDSTHVLVRGDIGDLALRGVVDIRGNVVIHPMYKNVYSLGEKGYIVQDVEDAFGYTNKDGKELVPCKYDIITQSEECECLIAQCRDKGTNKVKSYVYDYKGRLKFQADIGIDGIRGLDTQFPIVKSGCKFFLLNRKGMQVCEKGLNSVEPLATGTGWICKEGVGGKSKVLNLFRPLAECEEIKNVRVGNVDYLAYRNNKDGMCVVDYSGTKLVEGIKDLDKMFECGEYLFYENMNEEYRIVHLATWKEVEDINYRDCSVLDNKELILVQNKKGLWGVLDSKLQEVLPMVYVNVSLCGGYLCLTNRGKITFTLNIEDLCRGTI